MEQEFAKLKPNDSLGRWKVCASTSVVLRPGHHEVGGHVALIVMKLNASMTSAVLTVVFEDVRLIAVHLDTRSNAIQQTGSLLNVGDDRLGGVVYVWDLPEGNVLFRERIQVRLPSSGKGGSMHLAPTDDGI